MPDRLLLSSLHPGARRAFSGLATAVMVLAGMEPGLAVERISGPVTADVVRVIDGDTLTVKAQIWLGQELTVSARIRGIDAPEIHGKCMREKSMAAAATNRLFAIAGGTSVRLTNVEEDKYGGRVIADVTTEAGVRDRPGDARERPCPPL